MSLRTILIYLTAISVAGRAAAGAQEHPARRIGAIVSVAVEEYAKGIDDSGHLISAQEYQETVDFLRDAKVVAARLSGDRAIMARAVLDSIVAAVNAKKPPSVLHDLETRFAAALGAEAALELPAGAVDLAAGREIFTKNCASCHGTLGLGDGPAAAGLNPKPPALASSKVMREVTPATMFRIASVGVPGTPMAGFASALTAEQRWNVVSYLISLRAQPAQVAEGEGLFLQRCSSCHAVTGASDAPLARTLSKLPPEVGTFAWQVYHSDAQLAGVVHAGLPGTAMPATPDLSDAQLASVVAYVRTIPQRQVTIASADRGADTTDATAASRNVVALLEQSLTAARSGQSAEAGDKAFDAYIAFEPLEGQARAKNPGLVASMERMFADFKGAVRGNDIRGAERTRDAIEATLPAVRELTRPAGSATEAFWQSFLIILREGFEAILVIGAVVTFLLKTGHRERLRSIWLGVGAALVASALTAIVLKTVLSAMPASREIIEGATLLIAVAVLFSVSYWLISKVEAAKWQAFIREKVSSALESGGGRALALVAFLAVYREGAETALFYQALFNEGPHVALPLSLGILVGFAVLAVVFTLFYRYGVKLPLRPFFAVTSVLLYYMAFVFMGKGIRELQEGNAMPISVIQGFPHVEALGLYPTWQSVVGQLLLLLLFVFALLKTFWPRRAVTLPTVPADARPAMDLAAQFAALREDNERLRARIGSLEEQLGAEAVREAP